MEFKIVLRPKNIGKKKNENTTKKNYIDSSILKAILHITGNDKKKQQQQGKKNGKSSQKCNLLWKARNTVSFFFFFQVSQLITKLTKKQDPPVLSELVLFLAGNKLCVCVCGGILNKMLFGLLRLNP